MNNDELSQQITTAANLGDIQQGREYDLFARLQQVKEYQTRTGQPFLVLELADLEGVVPAKIWSNAEEAMQAAEAADAPAEAEASTEAPAEEAPAEEAAAEEAPADDEKKED